MVCNLLAYSENNTLFTWVETSTAFSSCVLPAMSYSLFCVLPWQSALLWAWYFQCSFSHRAAFSLGIHTVWVLSIWACQEVVPIPVGADEDALWPIQHIYLVFKNNTKQRSFLNLNFFWISKLMKMVFIKK